MLAAIIELFGLLFKVMADIGASRQLLRYHLSESNTIAISSTRCGQMSKQCIISEKRSRYLTVCLSMLFSNLVVFHFLHVTVLTTESFGIRFWPLKKIHYSRFSSIHH